MCRELQMLGRLGGGSLQRGRSTGGADAGSSCRRDHAPVKGALSQTMGRLPVPRVALVPRLLAWLVLGAALALAACETPPEEPGNPDMDAGAQICVSDASMLGQCTLTE